MMKRLLDIYWVICRNTISVIILLAFTNGISNAQKDDLDVLTRWLRYTDASNSLYHHLTGEAYQILDAREEAVSRLKTKDEWKQRQLHLRNAFWDVLGPFPEKTPLNPQKTGEVKKEGYTIENIIYESLPGFYVTASLFIPDHIQKPAPAILFCSGHSSKVYRLPYYQLPLLNLVKKGFIVLAFDPIGQGERLQYFDPVKQKSMLGSSTKEHSYPSIQVFLLGQSIARYWIWDGIRGIDYLLSREEVDPDRIGVQGLSGGGTQTAYISAMDNRVLAAAPACYITNFRRLMESRGLQDGEQNFYHGIANGLDHADFFVIRAPKPSLIMATTRDIFSIQGVYETYSEAKRVYGILGKPDHMQMVEDDREHDYTRKTREAMYTFFQEYLYNPGSSTDEEVEYVPEEELQKTPTGQLSTSLKGETVFSLNLKESEKYADRLEKSRKDIEQHLPKVIISARKLSGFRNPPLPENPVFTGRFQKDHYVIEKYFVKGEGDYVIPYLLFKPEKTNHKAVIYLHPEGKSAGANPGGEIEWFIKNGFIVLSPDLLGTGELGNGAFKGDAYISQVSYNLWYTAMQIGRSIVGIHAADVITLAKLLDQNDSIHEVYGVAIGAHAPVLMHAAAFDPAISRIGLISPYISYRSVVSNRFYKPDFVFSMVPGALTEYDLPDLCATLAPNNLIMAGITDANGDRICGESLNREIEIIKEGYRHMNAGNQLVILPPESLANPDVIFGEWMK